MEKELILEIGTEEIPALFLGAAAENLRALISGELENRGLEFAEIEILYTPRRLAARVEGLERRQRDRTTVHFGPPVRAAFDENGGPTKAALGFARSQKVNIAALDTAKRDNGEFLCVRKTEKGKRTPSVLKEILPGVVMSISFRKSMRWGSGKTSFARPIRWIVAVYDGRVVKFEIGGVKSSDSSFGHRFTSKKPFRVEDWKKYLKTLEKNDVVADPGRRKEIITRAAAAAAAKIGGVAEYDPELLETVSNLVESPSVLTGKFEKKYLRLPEEVLACVMKNHQKYFPVRSKKTGRLLPSFIFACGTPVRNTRVVVKGNEKVIRARLNDAEFFFAEDTKKNLADYSEDLESMVFLSETGSYGEKVRRMKSLAALFSDPDIERAAALSKSDLATQMVFEFPELQGVMGKHYSRISGEKKAVSDAVGEQYMPLSRGGELPATKTGALLSVIDKADSVCACFAAGLVPTGSADPYAVRRQALGIIRIAVEKKFDVSLSKIFGRCLELVSESVVPEKSGSVKMDQAALREDILAFFAARFRNMMTEEGRPKNIVEAVVSAGLDNPLDAHRRIRVLEKFSKRKDFEKLATGFKRVFNIAKTKSPARFSEKLLTLKEEKELRAAFVKTRKAALGKLSADEKASKETDYASFLASVKTLSGPIDRFFDAVMVMDKNKKTRNNRLALLDEIKDLFFMMADFSKI